MSADRRILQAAICTCGHSAYWHGQPGGAGACDHDGQCFCEAFTPPPPGSVRITLPPGVRHCSTDAFATSWEAWDALSEADGWDERSWYVADPGPYYHVQKEALIAGARVIVYPPSDMRAEQGS